MENDDVSNDGAFSPWREPKEQVADRKKEKALALEAVTVVEKLMKHFDERIKFRDSLDAIAVGLEEDPAMYQKVCETNRLLKMALIEEKELLQEQLDMYGPK